MDFIVGLRLECFQREVKIKTHIILHLSMPFISSYRWQLCSLFQTLQDETKIEIFTSVDVLRRKKQNLPTNKLTFLWEISLKHYIYFPLPLKACVAYNGSRYRNFLPIFLFLSCSLSFSPCIFIHLSRLKVLTLWSRHSLLFRNEFTDITNCTKGIEYTPNMCHAVSGIHVE